MQLPAVIPIFPLPNVVLFPGVPLPLHIFEPRYREMVRDALASHELIGMTLLRGDWEKTYAGVPAIFEVGCAGRIVNAERLADGRFNIVLHGVREFTVRREIRDRSYRQAEVGWHGGVTETLTTSVRTGLVEALHRLLATLPQSPAVDVLQDPSLPDEVLVNFFAFALDFAPLEKQGLLQAEPLATRAERLREVVEFRIDEAQLSVGRPAGERWH